MPKLEEILQQLESDKIKTRTEASAALREHIQRPAFIAKSTRQQWEAILEAASALVKIERNVVLKAKSVQATAISRVQDAASLYRLAVEKSVRYIQKKPVKQIMHILVTVFILKGRIYEPLAPEAFKIMTAILAYEPHIDALDDADWIDAVRMCFGAAFRQKIHFSADDMDSKVPLSADETSDAEDYEDRENNANLAGKTELADIATALAYLLTSMHATFGILQVPGHYLARFVRLLKLIRPKPSVGAEIAAHLPLLQALNALLSQIGVNCSEELLKYGPRLWHEIIALWYTKNSATKEQILAALTRLAPVVFSSAQSGSTTLTCASEAWTKAIDDAAKDRSRVDELSLDTLVLYQERSANKETAFTSVALFPSPMNFTQSQAVAWLFYALSAECLLRLFQLSEQMSPLHVADSPGPSKRRKVEDPFFELMDSLGSLGAEARSVVHRLQIMHFFVSSYWLHLEEFPRVQLQNRLIGLLSHSDVDVVTWSFLVLGVIAKSAQHQPEEITNTSPRKSQKTKEGKATATIWDQAWSFAIRRLPNKATCRAAAFCAEEILARSIALDTRQARPLVSVARLSEDIGQIFRELNVHGPACLSDAACQFLATCILLARTDAELFRQGFPEKICDYFLLGKIWPTAAKRSQGSRKPETLHGASLFRLFASVLGLESMSNVCALDDVTHLPACDAVWTLEEMTATRLIQKFSYEAAPPYVVASKNEKKDLVTTVQSSQDDTASQSVFSQTQNSPSNANLSMRLLSALVDRIRQCQPKSPDEGGTTNERAVDLAFCGLQISVCAALLGGLLRNSGQAAPLLSLHATVAGQIRATVVHLSQNRHLSSRIDHFMGILRPLFITGGEMATWASPSDGLLILNETMDASLQISKARQRILEAIWTPNDMISLLDQGGMLNSAAQSILFGKPLQVESTVEDDPMTFTQTQSRAMDVDSEESDDGFGSSKKTVGNGQLSSRSTGFQSAAVSSASSPCLRMRCVPNTRANTACSGLLTLAYLHRQNNSEGLDRTVEIFLALIEAVAEAGHDVALDVLACLANSFRHEIVAIDPDLLEGAFNHLGSVVMPTYDYGKSIRTVLVAIDLLSASAKMWAIDREESQATEHARTLCTWLTGLQTRGKLSSWRARLALAFFMERYSFFDIGQSNWGTDDGRHKTREDGQKITPLVMIPALLEDADFRVRYRACTSACRLIEQHEKQKQDWKELGKEITAHLSGELKQREQVLTRALALANIMIAAPNIRWAAFATVLALSVDHKPYVRQLVEVLNGVVVRIGLSRLSQLHDYSIAFTADSFRNNNSDLSQVPDSIVGYTSKKARYQACFVEIGATYLAFGADADFSKLRRTVQLDEGTAVRRCLPLLTARTLWRAIPDRINPHILDQNAGMARMDAEWPNLRSLWDNVNLSQGEKPTFEALIKQELVQVIVGIVSDLHTESWKPQSQLYTAIAWAVGPESDKITRALELMVEFYTDQLYAPQRETAHPTSVLLALVWLDKRFPFAEKDPYILYGVCQALLAQIQQTPFVEEQIRLILAMALILSFCHRHLRNPALQRLVIHGLSCIYENPELSSTALGVIYYVLRAHSLAKDGYQISSFSAIVSRLAHTAFSYTENSSDLIQQHARHHLDSIDSAMDKMYMASGKSVMAKIATEVWVLWPGERSKPGPALTFDEVATVFKHCPNLAGRFNVVQRLAESLSVAGQATDRLDGELVWSLLESLRAADISKENGRAFAEVLIACGGAVQAPKSKPRRMPSPPADLSGYSKSLIVGLLADLLLQFDLTVNTLAFSALRNIFSGKGYQFYIDAVPAAADVARDIGMISELADASALVAPQVDTLMSLQDLLQPVWIERAQNFESWISAMSAFLLQICAKTDHFFGHLTAICQRDSAFAKDSLPMLVMFLLLSEEEEAGSNVAVLSRHFENVLNQRSSHQKSIQVVVDAVIFLRQFTKQGLAAPVGGDFWLSLPWLSVARGALAVGDATISLLCLELAHEHQAFDPQTNHSEDHKLVLDVFENLAEPDSFYGLRSKDALAGLVRKFRHEQNYRAAFELNGALFESAAQQTPSNMGITHGAVVTSLASFGLRSLGVSLLQIPGSKHANYEDPAQLDLAWRTEVWNLPLPSRKESPETNLHIYNALKTLHQSTSLARAQLHIKRAYSSALGRLQNVSASRPIVNPNHLRELLLVNEIDRWTESGIRLHREGLMTQASAIVRQSPETMHYDTREAILASRVTLVRSVRKREEVMQFTDLASPTCLKALELEQSCHYGLSQLARSAGRFQIALNEVTTAYGMLEAVAEMPDFTKRKAEIEEELANVLWDRGEHTVAMDLVRGLISAGDSPANPLLLAKLGAWTYEARLESAKETAAGFFVPAAEAARDHVELVQINLKYLQLADSQLFLYDSQQMAMQKIEADTMKRRLQVHQLERHTKNTVDDPNQTHEASLADSAYALEQDEARVATYKTDRQHFLELTMRLLVFVLGRTDTADDNVFRFVSLWFAHANDEALNAMIGKELETVPSAKFVFLAPQLTSRMTKEGVTSPSFRLAIASLVERLCLEHPFHLLYQIYALRLGSLPRVNVTEGKKPRKSTQTESQSARLQTADSILNKLRKKHTMGPKLDAFHLACNAFVEWAAFDLAQYEPYSSLTKQQKHGKTVPIPPTMRILQLRDLPLPVSTCTLPVDRSAQYDSAQMPTISHYNKNFKTAGGLNLPKITTCVANSTKTFKQLFKGGDDTRQDAVMEQVFALVNTLLSKEEQSAKRLLHVCTYSVIPLGSRTGLMEFVANSRPLSEIMTETLAIMRPKDWTYPQCRKHVGNTPHTDIAARVQKVEKCFEQNKPIFRHFFFSSHKHAASWFAMRLNYTRSVAVNSIVGHILGIGDRHVSNLLLDTSEGDLVPIDFGITFDAGMRLGQPELVPFRLTRNIVDGFGMTGVEGVYRRCCEETLRVLRERSSVILTILEVFKYDPLQKWDISEAKIRRLPNSQKSGKEPVASVARPQRSSTPSMPPVDAAEDADENVPAMALQALASVTEKLKNNLSVEYTVNDLIQQAQDIKRLSTIFPGWQPWV